MAQCFPKNSILFVRGSSTVEAGDFCNGEPTLLSSWQCVNGSTKVERRRLNRNKQGTSATFESWLNRGPFWMVFEGQSKGTYSVVGIYVAKPQVLRTLWAWSFFWDESRKRTIASRMGAKEDLCALTINFPLGVKLDGN